jgi:hypothetical protein
MAPVQAPHLSLDRLPRPDPIGWWRGASLPQRLFVALVVFGALLRIAACLAWWPMIPTFADSWPYAVYAAHHPFGDVQHPAGYSLFLAFLGLFSRQVAVVTVVTHVIGVVTGCLLYAAVKRLTGSAWPALLAAAFVLLNADQVYQEQLVASEPLSAFLLVLTLYAGVRLFDSRAHRLHWSVAVGALAAATTIVRTESIFLAPVVALAIIVALWPSLRRNWRNVQFPIVMLLVWGVMLVGYGLAKQAATGSFVVGPAPGWQEYGRAATFANCKLFTPPPGTRGLCESTPPANRFGHDHYLYDPTSPAVRLFGGIGNQDGKVGAWSRAAIESQPGLFLRDFYEGLRDYYIPSDFHYVPGAGGGLDSELNWAAPVDPKLQHDIVTGMESFYAPFTPHRHPRRVQWLRHYQLIFRFGATMLSLCTLLTLLGLFIGSRRSRAGVILFGVSGFVLLLPEALLGAYLGRYTVPIAGPMGAAASIVLWNLVGMERARRSSAREHGAAGLAGPGLGPGQVTDA